jgi:hypothetical protein
MIPVFEPDYGEEEIAVARNCGMAENNDAAREKPR